MGTEGDASGFAVQFSAPAAPIRRGLEAPARHTPHGNRLLLLVIHQTQLLLEDHFWSERHDAGIPAKVTIIECHNRRYAERNHHSDQSGVVHRDPRYLVSYNNLTPFLVRLQRECQDCPQSLDHLYPIIDDINWQAKSTSGTGWAGRDIPEFSHILCSRHEFVTVRPELTQCSNNRPLS